MTEDKLDNLGIRLFPGFINTGILLYLELYYFSYSSFQYILLDSQDYWN